MRALLVTGSSGFLGSRVVEHALRAGFFVIGVDIKPPKVDYVANFEFWQTDVNSMPELLPENVNFIVHTASSLPFGNNAEQFETNNINAARKISSISKLNNIFLVEIGSSSVYGKPIILPVNRSTPIKPLDLYARSKAKAEVEIHRNLEETEFCIIRPRTILGTGRTGIFSIFFSLILRNLPLPLPNGGRQVIQFVHVDDLAALSIHLGKNRISGLWPAASPEPKPLIFYLRELGLKYNQRIRYIPVNAYLFKYLGILLYKFKLTKFTPWHFGAFPYDNYVDPTWIPDGFQYEYTSLQAFEDTYLSTQNQKIRLPKLLKIGKKI